MKTILKYGLLTLPTLLLSDTMFLKTDANIRSNPSLQSNVVTTMKKNAPIEVIKKVYTKNNGTWYQTSKGYLSVELVRKARVSNTSNTIKEYIVDNASYVDASKTPSISKDLYIDKKTDTVYTLIPEKLAQVLIKQKEPKLPPKPDTIYGDFSYATAFANEDKQVSSKKPSNSYQENQSKFSNYKYFVGISLGKSSFSVNKKELTGSIELNTPNNKANLFKLQGGVMRDNYIASINYERNSLDDLDTDALYLSLDHTYPNFYNIYAGLSLGYIQGTWNKDLLVNSVKTKDQKMSSYLYGLHTGWRYTITPQWDFISQVSYQRFELDTDLISTPAKSEIKMDEKRSLEFGVRYNY